MSARHFFIVGTPRSRTAWLATFLDTPMVSCQHEGLARAASMDIFQWRFADCPQPVAGECGTLGAAIVPALRARFPQARWAFIHRDVGEVAASLKGMGVKNPELAAMQCERIFQEAREQVPHAPLAEWVELDREDALRDLWSYVTWGEPFPFGRWERLRELQIQIAPRHFLDLLEQRTPRVQALVAAMREEVAE